MLIEATTMGHLVDRQAQATPEREALVFPDARLTYAQLAERSDAFARSLLGLGVEAGDKVAILLANRVEFVLALFGAAKAGAIVVPVNARFKVTELSHVIAHSDARVLITAAAPTAPTIPRCWRRSSRSCRSRTRVRCASPTLQRCARSSTSTPTAPASSAARRSSPRRAPWTSKPASTQVRVRDVAMLMYTSGTSARPKGCLLTHEALVRHGGTVARARFDLTAEDTLLGPAAAVSHRWHRADARRVLGRREVLPRRPLRARRRAADARRRARDGHLSRVRDDLAAGARPRRLRPLRPERDPRHPEHLRAGAADAARGAHAVGGAGVLLRRDRVREQPHPHAPRRRLRGADEHARTPDRGHAGQDHRRRDGRARAGRRRRRVVLQGLRALRGLLQGPRADRGLLRRRGLLPLAGPGQARRRRPADLHRPPEGHAQGGRGERLGDRGRGLPRRPPGGQHRPGRRRARRQVRRGRRRLPAAQARRERHRGGDRSSSAAARSRATRSRATCASSTSGRCQARRSRSSSCATRSRRSSVRPFRVELPLDPLRARLRETRWADDFGNADWAYGVERGWLRGDGRLLGERVRVAGGDQRRSAVRHRDRRHPDPLPAHPAATARRSCSRMAGRGPTGTTRASSRSCAAASS